MCLEVVKVQRNMTFTFPTILLSKVEIKFHLEKEHKSLPIKPQRYFQRKKLNKKVNLETKTRKTNKTIEEETKRRRK
jgi:hypothetical protein